VKKLLLMRHKYEARLFKDKRTATGTNFHSVAIKIKDQVQTSVQVYTAHAATTTTARWPADRQHKLWLQMMSADVCGSLGKMLRVEFRTRGVNFKQR